MLAFTSEGKYKFIFEESTGRFKCYRYNEDWRDLCGDGAVLSLLQELDKARDMIQDLLVIHPESSLFAEKETEAWNFVNRLNGVE